LKGSAVFHQLVAHKTNIYSRKIVVLEIREVDSGELAGPKTG
jgi:hypothetical protein